GDYAQEKLGDIVSVDLPKEGDEVHKGEPFGMIDSQKASAELLAPVSGVIVEVNSILNDDPSIVNADPYEDGWIIRIEAESIDELDELMPAEEYEEFVGEQEEEG
ncbi:MAG: glycine cleavage system protein GcvH, partial [Deltaproteobacteria bacterium]|nr:glycine cleavage system protein GcvH [Deltaproteobacteria bacterium]